MLVQSVDCLPFDAKSVKDYQRNSALINVSSDVTCHSLAEGKMATNSVLTRG